MVKKLGLIIAFLVLGFVGYVAVLPEEFRVERSVSIQAPPEKIFAHVNNIEKAMSWNPWQGRDPNIQKSYEGPAEGVGATYNWKGNKDVGVGTAKIVESVANEKVAMDLEFVEPMSGKARATFFLKPEGAGTMVTWAFDGNHNFIGKAFCLLFRMTKAMEKDFDSGLSALKAAVEGAS